MSDSIPKDIVRDMLAAAVMLAVVERHKNTTFSWGIGGAWSREEVYAEEAYRLAEVMMRVRERYILR